MFCLKRELNSQIIEKDAINWVKISKSLQLERQQHINPSCEGRGGKTSKKVHKLQEIQNKQKVE